MVKKHMYAQEKPIQVHEDGKLDSESIQPVTEPSNTFQVSILSEQQHARLPDFLVYVFTDIIFQHLSRQSSFLLKKTGNSELILYRIKNLLYRFISHTKNYESSLYISIILLDRAHAINTDLRLSHSNIYQFLMVSLLIAHKYCDDGYVTNSGFTEMFEMKVRNLISLTLEFLNIYRSLNILIVCKKNAEVHSEKNKFLLSNVLEMNKQFTIHQWAYMTVSPLDFASDRILLIYILYFYLYLDSQDQFILISVPSNNFMSKVLESIKPNIMRARKLFYLSRYSDSVLEFQKVIGCLQAQVIRIQDRLLIEEWNKIINEMKYEKSMCDNMIDVLAGNFQTGKKVVKQSPASFVTDDTSIQSHKPKVYEQPLDRKPKLPFGKEPFQVRAHEDDEIYNRKQKERIDRQQRQERQRVQRQKQFEEREAQIWPKKPVKNKKNSQANINQKPTKNRSIVNEGGNNNDKRDYSKPWLANVSKKKPGQQEKKSFLKHCYPDGSGPDADLINMLEREVIDFSPNITFQDIAQLEKAKDVLEEAVLLPLAMPHLFKGIRRAWKGVLLFGPPGTGKTLLAKAIASSGKTTFFSVTASSLASKWKGQSQKLMAKFYAPTTIFIDQIDAIASRRGQKEDQASRKVKTELMTRIDGASTGADDGKLMVVVGATNRPWDLDEAIRRRLEKRIYIPLPTQVGRRQLIRINLKNERTDEIDVQQIVKQTDGYSGADIANLCREAAYMPMRRKLKKQKGLAKKLADGKWMQQFQKEVNIPLTMDDFNQALKNVKPSVGKGDLKHYQEWMEQFGEQGTKM